MQHSHQFIQENETPPIDIQRPSFTYAVNSINSFGSPIYPYNSPSNLFPPTQTNYQQQLNSYTPSSYTPNSYTPNSYTPNSYTPISNVYSHPVNSPQNSNYSPLSPTCVLDQNLFQKQLPLTPPPQQLHSMTFSKPIILQHQQPLLPSPQQHPPAPLPSKEDVDDSKLIELEKRRKRKESHNAVERRRRDVINDKIQEMSSLLPGFVSFNHQNMTTVQKPNKGLILKKSVDYVTTLNNGVRNLITHSRELESLLLELTNHQNPQQQQLLLNQRLTFGLGRSPIDILGTDVGNAEVSNDQSNDQKSNDDDFVMDEK